MTDAQSPQASGAEETAAAVRGPGGAVDRTLDLTDLKALAHPLRAQILDRLSTYGPATASALAERLGESSGATSYHLRQLEKHGFVREDRSRGTARERWWERVPGGITLEASSLSPGSPERAASEMLIAEWERNRRQLLDDFTRRGEQLGPEWMEMSTISTSNFRLTAAQMGDLRDDLMAVIDRYVERYRGQESPGSRPVQTQINVFPIVDGVVTPEGESDVGGSGKNSGSQGAER